MLILQKSYVNGVCVCVCVRERERQTEFLNQSGVVVYINMSPISLGPGKLWIV